MVFDGGRFSLHVGWRSRDRWEGLPDKIWKYVKDGSLEVEDVVLYLWLRRSWRPTKLPISLPRRLLRELFGLASENHLLGMETRLTTVGLLSVASKRGRAGTTLYTLHSLRRPGALLDKHAELRGGHFDRIPHGVFLLFGEIAEGRVLRYHPPAPWVRMQGAGAYLYLLHRANLHAWNKAHHQPITEDEDEDEELEEERPVQTRFWDVAAPADDDAVELTWRGFEKNLHLGLDWWNVDKATVEALGWLRWQTTHRGTRYDIADGPAGLLDMVLLAYTGRAEEEMAEVDTILDDIESGKLGLGGLLDLLQQSGIELTPEGLERLRVEVLLAKAAPTAPQYEFTGDKADRARRGLQEIGLGKDAEDLLRRYGPDRVWALVFHVTQRTPGSIMNPSGWVLRGLKEDWSVPAPPGSGLLDFNGPDYQPGGKYYHLFHRDEEEASGE